MRSSVLVDKVVLKNGNHQMRTRRSHVVRRDACNTITEDDVRIYGTDGDAWRKEGGNFYFTFYRAKIY